MTLAETRGGKNNNSFSETGFQQAYQSTIVGGSLRHIVDSCSVAKDLTIGRLARCHLKKKK